MSRSSSFIKSEDYSIPSSAEGADVFIRFFGSQNPELHFIIVHGALEHSGRHQDLVNFLLKSFRCPIAVTTFDHIGHGRSGGVRAFVPQFDNYVIDLGKVGEFVQTKNSPQTKTFILSHSLGGLITLTRILEPKFGWPFPLSGLIFSSPCIKPKMILGDGSEKILDFLDPFGGKFRLPMLYKGIDLTRDPERANDFDLDTLIPRFITIKMCKEIIEASARIRGESYYLKVPSLFLISGQDKIVDSESTALFAMGIEKHLTQTIKYPEHFHELWNEIDRQQIFVTMKKWIDKTLKDTP